MTDTGVEVRRATSADMSAVGTLASGLVAAHHAFDRERFLAATGRTASGYASFLAAQLDDPDVLVLVAELEGAIVGYAYAAVEGTDWMSLRGPAGVVHDLFVVDSRRGHTIGRRLLDAVLHEFDTRGTPQVVLSTAAANTAAQRFFARAGFRPTMIEMTRGRGSARPHAPRRP